MTAVESVGIVLIALIGAVLALELGRWCWLRYQRAGDNLRLGMQAGGIIAAGLLIVLAAALVLAPPRRSGQQLPRMSFHAAAGGIFYGYDRWLGSSATTA